MSDDLSSCAQVVADGGPVQTADGGLEVDHATALALRASLTRALVEQVEAGPGPVRAPASEGHAMGQPGVPFEQVLHAADVARYERKTVGRRRDGMG